MELFRKLDKVVSRLNKIPNRESTFMTENQASIMQRSCDSYLLHITPPQLRH